MALNRKHIYLRRYTHNVPYNVLYSAYKDFLYFTQRDYSDLILFLKIASSPIIYLDEATINY